MNVNESLTVPDLNPEPDFHVLCAQARTHVTIYTFEIKVKEKKNLKENSLKKTKKLIAIKSTIRIEHNYYRIINN